MFEHWDSFYLLIGGAAGALIGLLFIVATLTRGDDQNTTMRAVGTYMTPIVFHLSMVLGLSAFTSAPALPAWVVGAVIAVCAGFGAACAGKVIVRMTTRQVNAPHWSDLWCYGVAPLAAYGVLAGGALATAIAPELAPWIVAAGLLALLFIAIRNAWDLVTWITVKIRADQAAGDETTAD